MVNRALPTKIPIWVRVPGVIALVLVGVLLSTALLGALDVAGRGGGHGPDDEVEMDRDCGDHGRDDRDRDCGDHGGGDRNRDDGGHSRGDWGRGGPAAPAAPDLPASPAQVVTFAMKHDAFEPAETAGRRGVLARLDVEGTGVLLHDFAFGDVPIEDMRGRA
jgi:hypothetical protein